MFKIFSTYISWINISNATFGGYRCGTTHIWVVRRQTVKQPTVLDSSWNLNHIVFEGSVTCYVTNTYGRVDVSGDRLLSIIIIRLTPNDPYMGRTAPLTTKRCILYIYSTNVGTEYFKHALYSPFFFSLQNAVCFIMLTCLVPVLFTFHIQDVLKLKIIIPAPKGFNHKPSWSL